MRLERHLQLFSPGCTNFAKINHYICNIWLAQYERGPMKRSKKWTHWILLVTFQVMYGALVACLVLRAVFIVTWWVCQETLFSNTHACFSWNEQKSVSFFSSFYRIVFWLQGVSVAQATVLHLPRSFPAGVPAVEHRQHILWHTEVSVV